MKQNSESKELHRKALESVAKAALIIAEEALKEIKRKDKRFAKAAGDEKKYCSLIDLNNCISELLEKASGLILNR